MIEVKVPQLSESVAEATLVSWHKKAGGDVFARRNLIDHRDRQGRARNPGGRWRAGQNHQGRRRYRRPRVKSSPSTPPRRRCRRRSGPAAAAGRRSGRLLLPARPAAAPPAGGARSSTRRALRRRRRRLRPWRSRDQGPTPLLRPEGRPQLPPPAAAAALPTPRCGALGDRPEQRVPMTRLRARIAERLMQSKNETPS